MPVRTKQRIILNLYLVTKPAMNLSNEWYNMDIWDLLAHIYTMTPDTPCVNKNVNNVDNVSIKPRNNTDIRMIKKSIC